MSQLQVGDEVIVRGVVSSIEPALTHDNVKVSINRDPLVTAADTHLARTIPLTVDHNMIEVTKSVGDIGGENRPTLTPGPASSPKNTRPQPTIETFGGIPPLKPGEDPNKPLDDSDRLIQQDNQNLIYGREKNNPLFQGTSFGSKTNQAQQSSKGLLRGAAPNYGGGAYSTEAPAGSSLSNKSDVELPPIPSALKVPAPVAIEVNPPNRQANPIPSSTGSNLGAGKLDPATEKAQQAQQAKVSLPQVPSGLNAQTATVKEEDYKTINPSTAVSPTFQERLDALKKQGLPK